MPEIQFLPTPGQQGQLPVNLYFQPATARGLPSIVGRPGTTRVKTTGVTGDNVRQMGLHYDPTLDKTYLYVLTGKAILRCPYDDLGTALSWETGGDALTTQTGYMIIGETYVLVADVEGGYELKNYPHDGFATAASRTRSSPDNIVITSWAYQDTYYFCANNEGYKFYVSGANYASGGSGPWSTDNWGKLSAYYDTIRQMTSYNRTLHLFGRETIEFWRNTGIAGGVPFSRVQGSTIKGTGIGHGWEQSLAPVAGTLYFVSNTGEVISLSGYNPQVVSTPVVVDFIRPQIYGTVTGGYGMTILVGGREMYMLTVPGQSINLVYDPLTQTWWKWSYSATSTAAEHKVMCSCITPYGCLLGTQSAFTGEAESILSLSSATTTDANNSTGQAIYREYVLPEVIQENITVHSKFELRSKEPDSAISVTLYTSDDGGDSYTSQGANSSATGRHVWYRLGATRRRIYKISSSTGSSEHEYQGAYISASGGTS